MSYDVSIGKESFNMTSNISGLFYDHIPEVEGEHRGGIHAIHGKTGKQAAEILSNGLKEINKTRHKFWKNNVVGEPEFCAKYDSPNGWGSAIGGLIFYTQIMAACYQNPRKKVYVCA